MASLLLAVGVAFGFILSSIYALQLITTARRRLPPGPLPLPLVGNLLAIGRRSPHRSLARLASRYGGSLMSVRLGTVDTVVVSSPDAVWEIHQKHNAALAYCPHIDVWRAHGHNACSIMALPPQARWRAMRKLCVTELFTPSRMNALQQMRRQKVQDLLKYVSRRAAVGEPFAIRDPVFTSAMNIMSQTLFSVDLGSGPALRRGLDGVVKEAAIMAAMPNVSDFFPAIAAADLQGLRRRMGQLVAYASQVFDELFAERDRGREACQAPRNDMLDVVLDKEHEWKQEGSVMDRNAAKGMFMDLFVAGTDSSSTAVEWAMACLLQNPEVMKKVKMELMSVVGKKQEVDEHDIAQLPYLQAVVKEVLRLHPPVAMSFYRAEATVQVGGYTIPKGTSILLNICAVHRNVDIWADPDRFMPERFMDRDMDFSGKNGKLIPFGGGRRICPGIPLAYRTVHLILASLLHQFDWTVPEDANENGIDMTEKFGLVVSMATPLKVIARRCDL